MKLRPVIPVLPRKTWSCPGDVPEWRALHQRATPTFKFKVLAAMQERSRANLVACLRHLFPDWPDERIARKGRQIALIASLDPGHTLPEQFLAPIV
jgi:hypothetical protein